MSTKQPEIKFSPFEALLIGEKNRVLKRQPVKNTIFVTRLNQKGKTINLRALFDLEKYTTSSRSNNAISKIPQRVHEIPNNKKHSHENNKITENRGDILYHEPSGQKMFVKSNDSAKPQYKKLKKKSKKVTCKEKYSRDGNKKVVNKVHNALKNQSTTKKYNLTERSGRMLKVGLKEDREDMCSAKRYELRRRDPKITYKEFESLPCSSHKYELRGKIPKFTYETEYESEQSEEVNTEIKQDYLSNYECKFLTDNNKNIFNDDYDDDDDDDQDDQDQIENENLKNFEMPNLENISEWYEQFDLSISDSLLNELCKHNYYFYGGFEFPKCPEIKKSDFDDDENLVDIIYENFPKSLKFESEDSSDFIDALINAYIIKPVKDMETNVTEEILDQDQKVKVNCGTQTSSLDLPRPIDLSSCYHLEALRHGCINTADRFVAMQNRLITDESLDSLFLNNSNNHDKKDLLMESLMRPFIQNAWVRRLHNF